jgi:hypothetical protein
MVEMELIRKAEASSKEKQFGPFTSVVSFSALAGIWIGLASIILI